MGPLDQNSPPLQGPPLGSERSAAQGTGADPSLESMHVQLYCVRRRQNQTWTFPGRQNCRSRGPQWGGLGGTPGRPGIR